MWNAELERRTFRIPTSAFHLLVSQIGLNNGRCSLDFLGGAACNQFAMIKGYHAIRQA